MTRWKRSPRVLWRRVLDDVVLMAPDREAEPFAVAGGRRLWDALAEERGLDELAATLGADPSPELTGLLDSLAQAGVVDRAAT